MSSPFNLADIKITGDFIPDLNQFQFQDKCAITLDAAKCILVQWYTTTNQPTNQPGFILWCLDEKSKEIIKTKRFEGCCSDIKIVGDKVLVKVWSWDTEKKIDMIFQEEIDGII
jgi:hypothetical protein